MADASQWKVIGWQFIGGGFWTCALLMPNGSRYEPTVVGGHWVSKGRSGDYFTVRGYDEEHAKAKLREFIEDTQRDMDLKATGPQDFTFGSHGRTDPIADLKAAVERMRADDPPDTSWVETGPEEKKSLWQQWREKRAEKKNSKVQARTPGPQD